MSTRGDAGPTEGAHAKENQELTINAELTMNATNPELNPSTDGSPSAWRPSRSPLSVAAGILAVAGALAVQPGPAVAQQATQASMEESAEAPTWAEDVLPIFQESCVECHRPNSIAPMSLQLSLIHI